MSSREKKRKEKKYFKKQRAMLWGNQYKSPWARKRKRKRKKEKEKCRNHMYLVCEVGYVQDRGTQIGHTG